MSFLQVIPGRPLSRFMTSLIAQPVKNLPAMRETWVGSLGWEDSLEKGMVTPLQYSSLESAAAAKSLQSYLTLCDPIDGSPPGSPVLPGILQARALEW